MTLTVTQVFWEIIHHRSSFGLIPINVVEVFILSGQIQELVGQGREEGSDQESRGSTGRKERESVNRY